MSADPSEQALLAQPNTASPPRVQHNSPSQPPAQSPVVDAAQSPLVPAGLRDAEAAVATLTWLAIVPIMLHLTIHRVVMTVLVVVVVTALTLHSSSLSAFFQESGELDQLDDAKDSLFSPLARDDMQGELSVNAKPATRSERAEECKLIFTLLVILSAVGSAVAFCTGGAFVVHAWTADAAIDCNVADLADLQQRGPTTFYCNNGHVDLKNQLSILREEGGVKESYKSYRMAPVYSETRSKETKPLAFAVSINSHLEDEPCDIGICGILVPRESLNFCSGLSCISDQDKIAYAELRRAMNLKLGDVHYDLLAVPLVELSPPTNPNGKAGHFMLAAALYLFTFSGLVAIQFVNVKEAKNHRPSTFNAPGYEVIQ